MSALEKHYDVLVIGSGNAGQAAAGVARDAGKSVLVADRRELGGTCALRGCVPKKVLVAAAEVLDVIARASEHGIRVSEPKLDFAALMRRKQTFVEGVPDEVEQSLQRRGIDVARGEVRFSGAHEVAIDGRRTVFGKAIVATGSKPRALPLSGAEHAISSEQILALHALPESIVFIGAGVIAFEFAHVLARAGSRVTLLEMLPRPLPAFDAEAVRVLVETTRRLGIDVRSGVAVRAVSRDAGGFVVEYDRDNDRGRLPAACVAHGAGRVPDLDELDLATAEIELDGDVPRVDSHLRSISNPDVSFAGDALAGTPQLSPVATYEGRIAGQNAIAKGELRSPDYASIPSVVFTVPALAMVGLTEQQAHDRGDDVEIKRNDMTTWRSARTQAEKTAFAKVLVDKRSRRIVGAHLVGHGASETIHAFSFVMRHGLPASELENTVYAYPTFHSDLKHLVS